MSFWETTPPTWNPTTDEYYGRIDLIGSSALGDFHASRRLFHAKYVTGDLPMTFSNEAMQLGRLVDVMLTEPENFDHYYFVTDAGRRGTKDWRSDELDHPLQELIKRGMHNDAKRIVEAVAANEIAAGIMSGPGLSQVCHTWESYGVQCRARYDRVFDTGAGPAFADLKCWNVVEPVALARQVFARGTHRQMALYEKGFMDLWGARPVIMLVVVNSAPPHEVSTMTVGESLLRLGRRDVEIDLTDLRICRENGDYRNTWEQEVNELEAPYWAR